MGDMRFLFVSVVLASLAGCVQQPPMAQADPVQDARLEAIRTLRERWINCLKGSFAVTRTQTPDKSAAAEMSFNACITEERALISFAPRSQMTPEVLAALRVRPKQELMSTP